MENYKTVLKVFKRWTLLNYPESNLDIIVEDFDNNILCLKNFIDTLTNIQMRINIK